MGWVEIPNGAASFFYNEETSETTYTCPPSLLDEKLALYNAKNPDQSRTVPAHSCARSSPTIDVTDLNLSLKQSLSIDAPPTPSHSQSWTVSLHPDSGQAYYTNNDAPDPTAPEAHLWYDPFNPSVDAPLTINEAVAANIDIDHNEDEHELLAGYHLAPPHNSLADPESLAAQDKFAGFLAAKNIAITEDDGIKLKFPEYTDLTRTFDEKELIRSISIILPPHVSHTIPRVTVSATLGTTTGGLLDAAFKKYKTMAGGPLDKNGIGRYVFKICGYLDYMLHTDVALGYVDHIIFCKRKNLKIELELVQLTPADQMDLGPLLGISVEEEKRNEQEKMAVCTDNWALDITARKKEIHKMKNIVYQQDIKWPFRVLVRGIEDCPGEEMGCESLYVEIGLYYGGGLIGPTDSTGRAAPNTQPIGSLVTTHIPFSSEPSWPGVWLSSTKHEVAILPGGVRVGFVLWGTKPDSKEPRRVAGVSMTLVDWQQRVLTGEQELRLWPSQELQIAREPELANPKCERMPHILDPAMGVVGENHECDAGVIHVVFDSYSSPVFSVPKTLEDVGKDDGVKVGMIQLGNVTPSDSEKEEIERLSSSDPLHKITPQDKHLLWNFREYCAKWPQLLPKYLLSVQWGNVAAVREARKMLTKWRPYPEGQEVEYLEMLDIAYPDPIVREFICRQLNRMNDYMFDQYMLQMVQVLKYEPYHDSSLARMLVRRALQSPYKIGHNLYWLLKSEMHNADICGRYGPLLKAYVAKCGPHRAHLRRQVTVNGLVQEIAEKIKLLPKALRSKTAADELKKVTGEFPAKFQLCLSPRIECKGLRADKCKVMSSKKMPLWLVFENADSNGEPYLAIFKAGDDLRQDLMTLQLLKIMDHFWTKNGLDLRLNPYGCCATGHDLGMIEVVKNSDTTARIQVEYGGKNMGAWRDTPIDMFLREKNKDAKYLDAVQNFVHTCAGYCVATYVLGIGDRHADNIMVTNAGHLFHIDFGHFLGNFKSKFGYKRERAPFVFTPEMAYVMGNKDATFGFPDVMMGKKEKRIGFPEFESMCCGAYNVLRQHSNLLMNLFILVTPAAMPELLAREDVTYLKDMLSCDMTPEQADKKFKGEIAKSLRTVSRRFDNWIHNMKHG